MTRAALALNVKSFELLRLYSQAAPVKQ